MNHPLNRKERLLKKFEKENAETIQNKKERRKERNAQRRKELLREKESLDEIRTSEG